MTVTSGGSASPLFRAQQRIAALEANVVMLRSMLKRLEWRSDPEWGNEFCPICYQDKEQHHSSDCELKAVLAQDVNP